MSVSTTHLITYAIEHFDKVTRRIIKSNNAAKILLERKPEKIEWMFCSSSIRKIRSCFVRCYTWSMVCLSYNIDNVPTMELMCVSINCLYAPYEYVMI